jgi:hypothetical protein
LPRDRTSISPISPGGKRSWAPSSRARMYQRFRIPLFIASLLFLAASIVIYIEGLTAEAHEESFEERARRAVATEARVNAYAKRLRDDAFEHLGKGDDEIALDRLNEAASMDRKGDRTPEVQSARRKIADDLGLDDTDPAAAALQAPREAGASRSAP